HPLLLSSPTRRSSDLPFEIRIPQNAPELARIVIQQNALIEHERPVGVDALGSLQQQLPGHSQMHRQRAPIERHYNELAAPLNSRSEEHTSELQSLRHL